MKLIIKGDKKYVSWLAGHLRKEHPKTRKLMKISIKKNPKKRYWVESHDADYFVTPKHKIR